MRKAIVSKVRLDVGSLVRLYVRELTVLSAQSSDMEDKRRQKLTLGDDRERGEMLSLVAGVLTVSVRSRKASEGHSEARKSH